MMAQRPPTNPPNPSDPRLTYLLERTMRSVATDIRLAQEAEDSFRSFVTQAWSIVEPSTPLVPGFYLDALCDHLEAVQRGEIQRLLITIPPGFAKSTLVSVMFPVWTWLHTPQHRFLTTSYDSDLATRDAVRSRRIIQSEWFQRHWGDRFQLRGDQNVKTRYENNQSGVRESVGVNGAVTGKRADTVICDDPHNVKQTHSETIRRETVRWWQEAIPSRLNDPLKGSRIVIQQRIHEEDLAGVLMAQGGYDHLHLPMEYDPGERKAQTSIGWADPRSEPGELLHPERFGPVAVAGLKVDLGSQAYAAQYQQRPAPAEGGMFKRQWWRFWQPAGANLPPVIVPGTDGGLTQVVAEELPGWFDLEAQSWDMTFKRTVSGSFVVGLVGGRKGSRLYLLDCFRARVDFPGALSALTEMSHRWPYAHAKYIEDQANGPAIIDAARSNIAGIVAVRPAGSKEERAAAITPFVEAGNVVLPHPRIAPWVDAFMEEHAMFPHAAHDDQVDAHSQLALKVLGGSGDTLFEDVRRYYEGLGR